MNSYFRNVISRIEKDSNLLLVILLGALVIYVFNRGVSLGIDQGTTDRLRFHAIPVAIATLYHDFPHDYTSRKQIALTFQDTGPHVNEKIQLMRAAPGIDRDGEKYYWAADDRGLADFVIWSFKLFGPQESSFYKFYFVILLVSLVSFVIAYYRQREMLVLAIFFVAGIGALMPVLLLTSGSNFLSIASTSAHESPVGIFESRLFDVLSLLPIMHIALFSGRTARINKGSIGLLLIQVFIFFFLYHARSSLGWQLVGLTLFSFVLLAIKWRLLKERFLFWRPEPPSLSRISAAIGVVIIGLSVLSAYKHYKYDPKYFAEMGARTFWHNALMGLGSPSRSTWDIFPAKGGDYKVGFGDGWIVDAVIKYAKNNKEEFGEMNWNRVDVLNSLGGHSNFDWSSYEGVARKLYWDIVTSNKVRVFKIYAFVKPWQSIKTVIRTMVDRPGSSAKEKEIRSDRGLYFSPLGFPLVIFIILSSLLGCREWINSTQDIQLALFIFLLCGFIPSVAFYSAVLTQGGIFILTALCIYAAVPYLMRWIFYRYFLEHSQSSAAV